MNTTEISEKIGTIELSAARTDEQKFQKILALGIWEVALQLSAAADILETRLPDWGP